MNALKPQEELAAALETIPPQLIAKALVDALTSTLTTRQGTTEPDTRSRLAAADMILNRVLGRPIDRQQIVTQQIDSGPDIMEIARTNQHVREALRNQLAALDAQAAKDVAGRVVEVESPAEPPANGPARVEL